MRLLGFGMSAERFVDPRAERQVTRAYSRVPALRKPCGLFVLSPLDLGVEPLAVLSGFIEV